MNWSRARPFFRSLAARWTVHGIRGAPSLPTTRQRLACFEGSVRMGFPSRESHPSDAGGPAASSASLNRFKLDHYPPSTAPWPMTGRSTGSRYYWGVAPGTATNGPPGTIAEADMERMTRSGPVRLSGAMSYARSPAVGSCTVCSENGCDDSVVEEFVGERFTSSVTQGTAVCLIGPTPIPPPAHSCPTVANTR